MTTYIFLAPGFEEIEAMTPVDVLRRAGISVTTVSITDSPIVEGAHGVGVKADAMFADLDYSDAGWLIFPGGMPGASNLAAHEPLMNLLKSHHAKCGNIAAICASPAIVLAPNGILDDRDAVCYPGMETDDENIEWLDLMAAVDGNVVTGRGPGAAAEWALTIVEQELGDDAANSVASGMLL